MNELSTQRTPEIIAAEINNIKSQTRKMVLFNSIEIGRKLMEAKELLKHGDWGNWLESSVEYSQSTAENLIKIFKEYGSDQITLLDNNLKSQAFGNLSYSQALVLLGLPEAQREDFIKENNVDEMSTRELKKAIKEKEDALKLADEKTREAESLQEEKEKAEENAKYYEDTLKTEREDSKAKIEELEKSIKETKKRLKEAKASGNNEEVEKLQEKLKSSEDSLLSAHNTIRDLQEQLKDKPVDVTEIEKVPEETLKELESLRLQVKSNNDKAAVKFQIICDSMIENFQDLLTSLSEIKEADIKEKFKEAANNLVNKMLERL